MHTKIILSLALITGCSRMEQVPVDSQVCPEVPLIEVCFSPTGQCVNTIVDAIDSSTTELLVQAYVLTDPTLQNALIAAHTRGVNVRILADAEQSCNEFSKIDELAAAGLSILVDSTHATMHSKVIVADNKKVVTGSYNFTVSANRSNAENVISVESTEIAYLYSVEWQLHASHSTPWAC